MSACYYTANLPQFRCEPPEPENPLPWPELKTSIKELFVLNDKQPCFIIDTSCLNKDEYEDVDKIYWFAESNRLYYSQQWGRPGFRKSALPDSYLFVSLYDFEISEITGMIQLKRYGPPRKFLRENQQPEIIGLA